VRTAAPPAIPICVIKPGAAAVAAIGEVAMRPGFEVIVIVDGLLRIDFRMIF
jgi:hypothetical protein